MKRVLTAVVLVPLVLLAVFWAPWWLFDLLVAIIIVLALHEYLNIVEASGMKPFRWLTYIVSLVPIVAFIAATFVLLEARNTRRYAAYPLSFWGLQNLGALVIVAAVIFGVALIFRKDLKTGLASTAASTFGVFYIGVSLSLLILFRSDQMESILLIFVLFSVWAGDIAAYYVGRGLGKHKLAPVVSPNKTWEGAIASVIASVAVAIAIFHFRDQISQLFVGSWPSRTGGITFYTPLETISPSFPVGWVHIIVLGILTNIAAQCGDLFESALKRGANLKDSGHLLPGHGGVLDRIDALLFAVPVVWYYAQNTGFLQPKIF